MSTEVTVTKLPICDFCKTEPARYDGRTTVGPWAYMCEADWEQRGVGRLGTGFGQRLILRTEALASEIQVLIEGARVGPNAEIIIEGPEATSRWWRNLAGSLSEKARELIEEMER